MEGRGEFPWRLRKKCVCVRARTHTHITENSDVRDQHPRWMRVHLADVDTAVFPPHAGNGQSPIIWILEAHAVPRVRYVSSVTKSQEGRPICVPS